MLEAIQAVVDVAFQAVVNATVTEDVSMRWLLWSVLAVALAWFAGFGFVAGPVSVIALCGLFVAALTVAVMIVVATRRRQRATE